MNVNKSFSYEKFVLISTLTVTVNCGKFKVNQNTNLIPFAFWFSSEPSFYF